MYTCFDFILAWETTQAVWVCQNGNGEQSPWTGCEEASKWRQKGRGEAQQTENSKYLWIHRILLPEEVTPKPRQVVERTSKRQAVSQWTWAVDYSN